VDLKDSGDYIEYVLRRQFWQNEHLVKSYSRQVSSDSRSVYCELPYSRVYALRIGGCFHFENERPLQNKPDNQINLATFVNRY